MTPGEQTLGDPSSATILCHACRAIVLTAALLLLTTSQQVSSTDNTRASVPPKDASSRVELDGVRLFVDCRGVGPVTILFEAGLGGSALEWQGVQTAMASRARSCVYDRAGYGRSDLSPKPRHAQQLAREADALLSGLGIEEPLILVGHSFGGFVIRLLALHRASDMLALVLVDASHEDQLQRLETDNGARMMPRGKYFVISKPEIPKALPADVQARIRRYAQQHKSYAALHAEMANFRRSAQQVKEARTVVDYPVIVLRRGHDLYADDPDGARKTAVWNELQHDLAGISKQGRVVVAENSGHHVHTDEPALLVELLTELLDNAESLDAEGTANGPSTADTANTTNSVDLPGQRR